MEPREGRELSLRPLIGWCRLLSLGSSATGKERLHRGGHRAKVSNAQRTGSSNSPLQRQKQQSSDGIITGIDQAAERSSGISQALEGTEMNE